METQKTNELNISELVEWLNSHNVRRFSGATFRDHKSHRTIDVVYTYSLLPIKKLRLPAGYEFDPLSQIIQSVHSESYYDHIIVVINTAKSGFACMCMDKVRNFFAKF